MDFALADSVLYLNDGKKEHAGIISGMRLDVGIPSNIYYWANDTRRTCASAKKNTDKIKKRQSKRVQKKDQGGNYKLRRGYVYSVRAGFDHFIVNLTTLEFLSPITFIYKMT